MNLNQRNNLVNLLLNKGLISAKQASNVLASREIKKDGFLDFIYDNDFAPAEEIAKRIAEVTGIEHANITGLEIPAAILDIIPKESAEIYRAVAYDQRDNYLLVGLVDPNNLQAIEALEFLASQHKLKLKISTISREGFKSAFRRYDNLGAEVDEALKEVGGTPAKLDLVESEMSDEELEEVVKKAPVSQIVSSIIRYAVDGRASDIHVEPSAKNSIVRYRVDGVLKKTLVMPLSIHASIISRIKVLASLKLDETRVPQDGRITVFTGNHKVDFRVSVMPLINSEKAVLRIMDTEKGIPTLEDLGFQPYHTKVIRDNITRPHGLFLITGPTGSGKSTTLYSILASLDREKYNIVTLEDPVEFQVDGVNQSQIRPEVEFNFASGLRSLLRQDPDIIMVGEIRDNETAAMAIHAGLTGHLIFSTIHTNNSIGAIPRLIDMKVEPFLLASTLNLVMAQRLVRKICPYCKEELKLPDYLEKRIGGELKNIPAEYLPAKADPKNLVFYHGKGCNHCTNSGYKGRAAIAEVIQITRQLQKLIVSGYNIDEVMAEIKAQKMVTMMQDGIVRALQGTTTIEEVLRVTEE